jgi:hypothetical protein
VKKLALVSALSAGIASAHAQSNELVIQSFRVVPEGNGISAIIGTATNRTGRTFSAAFIEFNLYDSGGTVVGNTIDHVANLAPGNNWSFKAETPTRFATAKITKIQVFPPGQ